MDCRDLQRIRSIGAIQERSAGWEEAEGVSWVRHDSLRLGAQASRPRARSSAAREEPEVRAPRRRWSSSRWPGRSRHDARRSGAAREAEGRAREADNRRRGVVVEAAARARQRRNARSREERKG